MSIQIIGNNLFMSNLHYRVKAEKTTIQNEFKCDSVYLTYHLLNGTKIQEGITSVIMLKKQIKRSKKCSTLLKMLWYVESIFGTLVAATIRW